MGQQAQHSTALKSYNVLWASKTKYEDVYQISNLTGAMWERYKLEHAHIDTSSAQATDTIPWHKLMCSVAGFASSTVPAQIILNDMDSCAEFELWHVLALKTKK